MKLYVRSNNVFYFEDVSNSIQYVGPVSLDKWHFLSIRFNSSSIKVNLDGSVLSTASSGINLNSMLTYIGCSVDKDKKSIGHLNGCIEMLAFKDSFATDSEINAIRNNGETFSIRTYYDELGRTLIKKIHSKDTKFTYAKKNGQTSTKIASEQSFNGNDSISYDYDSIGNIKSINIDNGNIITTRLYEYDGLSRLKSSTFNNVTNTYEYDSNNIIKKNDIEYKYEGTLKDQLTSRSDGTTIT